MAISQLNQPFKTFRGRDSNVDGQVLYPIDNRTIARTFVVPPNPRSTTQVDVRDIFTVLTQGWSLVTDAENSTWEAYAKNLKRVDPDGVAYKISAKAAYIQVNFYNVLAGNAPVTTAPMPSVNPGIFVFS